MSNETQEMHQRKPETVNTNDSAENSAKIGQTNRNIMVVPSERRSCLKQWRRKLFTKEDKRFFHKSFGLLAIFSFIYRYAIAYNMFGNLNFTGDWFDWVTMIVHQMLSSSALIFHVLARRMIDKPMVIWEEYRLHAIIFTLRCFSLYVFAMYPPSSYRLTFQAMLIAAHHLVVDYITKIYGSKDHTTVRVNNTSSSFVKFAHRGYSFYQFLALASHLTPHERTADLAFNTIIAIQSSAFLMTLYRKGLVTQWTHGIVYSSCLILSSFHIFQVFPSWWFLTKVVIAFIMRTKFRMNKYMIWFLFVLTISYETVGTISAPAWVNSGIGTLSEYAPDYDYSETFDGMNQMGKNIYELFPEVSSPFNLNNIKMPTGVLENLQNALPDMPNLPAINFF